jgi:hypothetical protein
LLALELAPAFQPVAVKHTLSESTSDGAVRLVLVLAIGEPALRGKFIDVRECL